MSKPRKIRGTDLTNRNRAGGGGVSLPTPVFDVDFDSSIVPTTGTAGTFSRASDQYYATSPNALAKVTSGNPAVGDKAHADDFTSDVNGGLRLYGDIKNLIIQSGQFDNVQWVKTGSASVTASQADGPDGSSNTADKIVGSAASDSVKNTSATSSANNYAYKGSVWLKTSSGTHSVTINVYGTATNTPEGVTVTSDWQQFAVTHDFAGSDGNVGFEIIVNDTSGITLYAWEASLIGVNSTAGNDLRWDFEQVPVIPTTSATVTMSKANIAYSGAEITAARSEASASIWFFYTTHDATEAWDIKYIFNWHNKTGAWPSLLMLYFTSSGNILYCKYADNVAVNTGDDGVQGQWNLLTVATSNGDNETWINGVSIHSNAAATASVTPAAMTLGQWDTGTGSRSMPGANIIGRVQLFDSRISTADVLGLYNAQKGSYGL